MLDSILHVCEMLHASIFTWSEDLCDNFATYADSHEFKKSVIKKKWVQDIDLVEKIAKDEVIRGYFSDEDQVGTKDLNFSTLKVDL